jgi:Rrf2 family protein
MKLSRDTRYGLEALAVLVRRPVGEVVEARELADEAGLPSPYLAKIMQALARGGVLDSFRGRGYALPRPPEEVLLRDVIRAIDGDDAFWDGCIFWREECSETRPCPLHFRWRELKPEFTQVMGSITLSDIRDQGAARLFG